MLISLERGGTACERYVMRYARARMTTGPCPICPYCGSHDVVWLEATSKLAIVDYCRCSRCGHVLSVSRTDPPEISDVTPDPPPGKQ